MSILPCLDFTFGVQCFGLKFINPNYQHYSQRLKKEIHMHSYLLLIVVANDSTVGKCFVETLPGGESRT